MTNDAVMNQMFVATARGGDRTGTLARLGLASSPQVETDTPRSERLTRLLDERETALKANDPDSLALTEWRIDKLTEESRAARKLAESDQGAEQPQPSYDGGVRGKRQYQPGHQPESASSLFVRAMRTSQQERREREADPGQTITETTF